MEERMDSMEWKYGDRYVVAYSSCDGARIVKRFKSVRNARKFAEHWVGSRPEIGTGYALSHDGIGKVTCRGISLYDLFPGADRPWTMDDLTE